MRLVVTQFKQTNISRKGPARSSYSPAAHPARAMLLEHLPALAGKRVVLASASPRRKELLQQMGLKFEVWVD